MRFRAGIVAAAAAVLLLAGCSSTTSPSPRVTVTVTATPPVPTVAAGDAARWNLNAVCAAQSEIDTIDVWRVAQTKAGRLSAAQASAVLQSEAVQYLEMAQFSSADAVRQPVTVLGDASGTLEHPKIDLTSAAVLSAQRALRKTCQDVGLTLGVYAQGG